MSKATSIQSLTSDANISHDVENVLAEIEASKINETVVAPQQMQQMPQMPPPQQMPTQQVPQIPPEIAQQLQNQQPQQFYQNFPVPQQSGSGVMDFINGLMIQGPELKWLAIIAGLFVVLNLNQTVDFVGKYLPFTLNELGNSTMIGHLSRGLVLGLLFIIVSKFV